MIDFRPYHQDILHKVHQELESFFDKKIEEAKNDDQVLVEMIEVLKEFTLRGGKRVGPMMVVLGYQLAKKYSNQEDKTISEKMLIQAACAVEIHHLYLLNLDDMADRDVLRHGGKTLEEFYKTETFKEWQDSDHHGRTFSSIAGALLNSYTFEILRTSGFPADRITASIEAITKQLFSDTVVGWQIQYFQNNESITTVSEERFLKGLEFVTSRYKFVGPLMMGLTLCLSEKDSHFHELKRIYNEYGKHVGIAFQIQDDILGLFGNSETMGKAVGNDVREGKKTLLMQYAYAHGTDDEKQFIEEVIGKPLSQTELEKLQEIVTKTGSLEYSQNMAKDEVQKGIQALAKLPHEFNEVQILTSVAEYMIRREK